GWWPRTAKQLTRWPRGRLPPRPHRSSARAGGLLWQRTIPAMATLRIFAEDDVPAVAALFGRAYPEHRWASQSACESYIREMLFNNPWRDPELPSWVTEEHGRITGVYGVMPRPMLLCGRPIRVAVTCLFMVDPDQRNGLTALQL